MSKKLVIDFQHQFYKKSRLRGQKFNLVWLPSYFCGISAIWFNCQTQSNSVWFDWNTVQLGVINYSRIYLIKSCIFASIIEMKWFVSCYRFNTMYTKHARKFWSPPPMWVSECIHTPLYRREYLFLTVACLPFWGRQVTVRNTSAFTE